MQKLLIASAWLFLFSASNMLFQISAAKIASAETSLINGIASKILFRDGGAISQITIQLPVGYTDYLSKKIWQIDGVNICCAAQNPLVELLPRLIFFKTDMNGGNPSFIATYKDINELFTY